ncbi:exosortase family protein XrtF [Ascidiimonas sp. W6]|uniref:exosortase family protein XrtF n=1 Tax=Ascidiimonas meishanensis TaxID=3128903 RepID=UPI0030EE3BE4
MFKILKKYQPAIAFVVKFFLVYGVLTLLYNYYLSHYNQEPDSITQLVAYQSEKLMDVINYESTTHILDGESFVRFLVRDKPIAVIVEGCNSISVIILFLSFVIAFKGSFLNTILFILGGSLLIYLVNLFRIVLLLIGFYEVPEYKDFLHAIIFPLIIYGIVFLMWMIWVSKLAKK